MTGPHSTRRVFLIGFMGAGKSSVGKALARRLKWKFYDLDEFIENRERTSISSIFSSAGEAAFRTIESAALMELLKTAELSNSIIALAAVPLSRKRTVKCCKGREQSPFCWMRL